MMVSNPGDVPEYELNPSELQFKKGDEVVKVKTLSQLRSSEVG